jgi:hypothetical protein
VTVNQNVRALAYASASLLRLLVLRDNPRHPQTEERALTEALFSRDGVQGIPMVGTNFDAGHSEFHNLCLIYALTSGYAATFFGYG